MLGLALLAAPGVGYADYTTTLVHLGVENAGNYIIDADAFKLVPPGRSVISGLAILKYTRSGSVAAPEAVNYTLTWSLVDAAEVAHPLAEGSVLSGVTQVRQRYARDPRGLKCGPQGELNADTGEFVLRPVGDVLRFTPELGLIGDGTLTALAYAQGLLTPPLGADPGIVPVNALTTGSLPQATMKTLNPIEQN